MKQWTYKHALLLLLVGLLSTTIYAGGRKDFTKTIKKEFEITREGEVGLSNQFGKIEVNTWDKNRVKIGITIIARAETEKEAQDVFERIDFDFSNGKEYVKVTTEISSSKKNSWWGSWSSNSCDFTVNYEVFLPRTIQLDLENRHGDTYITELIGNGEIDIAHGSLTADGFDGSLDLEMAHGSGTVVFAKRLTGDISHSNIRFKKIGDTYLETAHCNIDIGQAKRIKLEGRHTDFELGDMDELRVDSRHCNFEIAAVNAIYSESAHSVYEIYKVKKLVDFDFAHGGATIDYLEKGFEKVSLTGSHTSFKIKVAENAAFELDLSGTHSDIRYPTNMNINYEKDKNNMQEVRGERNGSGAKGMIRASLSHGGLKIR